MYVWCVFRFSDGIKDWLWKLGREREKWEEMEIFYLPQGMTNKPWDLNKEIFEHQFEDMKTYMKKKEIEDSKNFAARRLRAVERAREKEERRAEYDPEGFFRPGTASSAASVVILPSNSFRRVISERMWLISSLWLSSSM